MDRPITLTLSPADLQRLARIADAAVRGAGLSLVPDVAWLQARIDAACTDAVTDHPHQSTCRPPQ